jgi:hypothetical protein
VLGRVGYGIEISPAFCDVILLRMAKLTGVQPLLEETGATLEQVAVERGVLAGEVGNPKLQDSRRIRHDGPRPNYG